MKTVTLIIMLLFATVASEQAQSDTSKLKAIRSISGQLVRYDSLYQSLPDTAIIQKRVLKQIMQNDLMKIVIAQKNEEIRSYQATNAIRWLIGNIGFVLLAGVGFLFYRYRTKGIAMTIVLIISVVLYLLVFNFIPELIS
jgi:hypothetical protein